MKHTYSLPVPIKWMACLLLLLAISLDLQAQTCSQTLRNAQRAYDEGRINEIPSIIEGCLRKGFSREEEIQAYKLLTLSYLYQYESGSADQAMLLFLRTYPDYQITPDDPAQFVKLYRQFRTWPVLLVGPKVGLNLASVVPLAGQGYSVSPDQEIAGTYRPNAGLQIGAALDVPLQNRSLSIHPALYLMISQYTYKPVGLFGYQSLDFLETQTTLAIPVMLKYTFGAGKKVSFYANAGGAVSYLLNASAQPEKIDRRPNDSTQTERRNTGAAIPLNDQRKKLNLYAVGGGGVRYKIGRNFLTLDANYWLSFRNTFKNTWTNDRLVYEYGYVSNRAKVHHLVVSVGFQFPIYNPKLLVKRN